MPKSADPVVPVGPVNEGPFDRMCHVGGGVYVLVRIGEPMPVPASAPVDVVPADIPEEG
jgi:hypothetical protein